MTISIKLQLENSKGEIEKENNLILNNDDILIMQYDSKNLNYEIANKFYNNLLVSLDNNNKLIAIPEYVNLKVLRKGV